MLLFRWKENFPKSQKSRIQHKGLCFLSIAECIVYFPKFPRIFILTTAGRISDIVAISSFSCDTSWFHFSTFAKGFEIALQHQGIFCWLWTYSELNICCRTPEITEELHSVTQMVFFRFMFLPYPVVRTFKNRLTKLKGFYLFLCLWDWYLYQCNNHLEIPLISAVRLLV